MATTPLRLDRWLVTRGYAETRSRAQWLIEAGLVWVRGQPCRKASLMVADSCQVEIRGGGLPYVSRGGLKLERALQAFGVNVAGLVALDIGASTGGFTDCMLQHGARRVYALDVGTGQLVSRLRTDPRVVSLEGRNIRSFQAAELPETVGLITVDVASLSGVRAPVITPFSTALWARGSISQTAIRGWSGTCGAGGVVRGPHCHALALRRVITVAAEAGFRVTQTVGAPCFHTHGNQEVFIDLGWVAERATLAPGRQPPPAFNVPT